MRNPQKGGPASRNANSIETRTCAVAARRCAENWLIMVQLPTDFSKSIDFSAPC
jgi:hypothetical protein